MGAALEQETIMGERGRIDLQLRRGTERNKKEENKKGGVGVDCKQIPG